VVIVGVDLGTPQDAARSLVTAVESGDAFLEPTCAGHPTVRASSIRTPSTRRTRRPGTRSATAPANKASGPRMRGIRLLTPDEAAAEYGVLTFIEFDGAWALRRRPYRLDRGFVTRRRSTSDWPVAGQRRVLRESTTAPAAATSSRPAPSSTRSHGGTPFPEVPRASGCCRGRRSSGAVAAAVAYSRGASGSWTAHSTVLPSTVPFVSPTGPGKVRATLISAPGKPRRAGPAGPVSSPARADHRLGAMPYATRESHHENKSRQRRLINSKLRA
jgi:hypothetical protein